MVGLKGHGELRRCQLDVVELEHHRRKSRVSIREQPAKDPAPPPVGEGMPDRAALIEAQIPGLRRFGCALLRGDREAAVPSDSTATSVVPPPTSTTIEPAGSVTGRPAPIAAAIGSSIRKTRRAPALSADSWIARRSTAVEPEGTQMICGVAKLRRLCALRMKCLIISSVTSKSAMTPSRNGRIA
jgi:hypothetical protein